MSLEEDLVWYLAWRSSDYGTPVTKTRLVKYLYLVDLRLSRETRGRATDLEWIFYHYGPYTMELEQLIESGEADGRVAVQAYEPPGGGPTARMVYPRRKPPSGLLPTRAAHVVDEICSRWAGWDLNTLLNFVYFETPPMDGADRGDQLDMLADLEAAWPRRPRPPLNPPEVERSAKEQMLALVRQRQTAPNARLRRPNFDEGYRTLIAPDPEDGDDEIRGLSGHLTLGPRDEE